MTATVDLLLLGQESEHIAKRTGSRCYEPKWCVTRFMDTSGTWTREGRDLVLRKESAKAHVIDALFGDGPKRHNLQTHLPVTFVGYDRKSKRDPSKTYLVRKTPLIQRISAEVEKMGAVRKKKICLGAMQLDEFLKFLRMAPDDSDLWDNSNVSLVSGFLEQKRFAAEKYLALPLIGAGFRYDFPDLFPDHWYEPSILRLAH